MTQESEKPGKVVDLSEARRRQKTVRKVEGASAKTGPSAGAGRKVFMYAQFVLFLGVLAYFMHLCRGPG